MPIHIFTFSSGPRVIPVDFPSVRTATWERNMLKIQTDVELDAETCGQILAVIQPEKSAFNIETGVVEQGLDPQLFLRSIQSRWWTGAVTQAEMEAWVRNILPVIQVNLVADQPTLCTMWFPLEQGRAVDRMRVVLRPLYGAYTDGPLANHAYGGKPHISFGFWNRMLLDAARSALPLPEGMQPGPLRWSGHQPGAFGAAQVEHAYNLTRAPWVVRTFCWRDCQRCQHWLYGSEEACPFCFAPVDPLPGFMQPRLQDCWQKIANKASLPWVNSVTDLLHSPFWGPGGIPVLAWEL